ncbi:hypothetical protein DFJ63DRAFT_310126 [Scheffersomyces coipomensis]|uniref:uncharacterized protein n=1 Tax=Scheffersomyces coipomensis TaxID=1788519 RepID=UPI00315DC919
MITSSQSNMINRVSSTPSLLNRTNNQSVTSIQTDLSHQVPSLPHHRLKHQPSLIDLIDDTTLTSLPLPPPPKKYNSSRIRNNSISTIPSLMNLQNHPPQQQDNQSSSSLDQEPELKHSNINFNVDIEDDDDEDEDDEGITFEGDESQDPIVLIEDYMINDDDEDEEEQDNVHIENSQAIIQSEAFKRRSSTINKKKSLANFKQRMYSIPNFKIHNELISASSNEPLVDHLSEVSTITSINTSSSLLRSNKRAISGGGNSTNAGNMTVRQNLEEIFGGKVPGSDLLKYCDICERPLYEISSLLGNYRKKLKKSDSINSNNNNNSNNYGHENSTYTNNYDEFICWECIDIYEDFFNELEFEKQHSHNHSDNNNDNHCNDKLLMIFKNIQQKYNQKENTPPPTSTRKEFSNSLILKLNTLKNISSSSSSASSNSNNTTNTAPKFDLDWIKNLQVKMNWSSTNTK